MIQGKNLISKLKLFVMLLLLVTVTAGQTGCKAKREAAEQARQEALRVESAKRDLQALLNDDTKTAAELEAALNQVRSQNINDPDVQQMIREVEEKIETTREEERIAREEEERRLAEEAEQEQVEETEVSIETYLQQIAGASDFSQANRYIDQALDLFESDDTPVLIIISKSMAMTDYDKPTTIRKYLELVKDQKRYDQINDIKFNEDGKITLLELIK